MKDYPIDKAMPVIVWPMRQAQRVTSKAAKALFVALYFVWFALLSTVVVPLIIVSMAMAIWDDVNER